MLSLLAHTILLFSLVTPFTTLSTYAHPSTLSSVHARVAHSKRDASPVAMTYFAAWHDSLTAISWSKYTHVAYAFATTTSDPSVIGLAQSDYSLLPKFIAIAHQHGVKASLSIGGWTGSQYFSSNVNSAANRQTFVNAIVALVLKYKLDGIDFDWEYPNHQGIGCNVIDPNDTPNFVLFLQLLRQSSVGARILITATTPLTTYISPDGTPTANVNDLSQVVDFITIMNYDVWGSWSSAVGPNAPLYDSCAAPADQQGSAMSAVTAWTQAGMPSNRIVLGVPAYGHSFSVARSNAYVPGSKSMLAAYPPFNASNQPPGDSWDGGYGTDQCGNDVVPSGVFDFWGLVANNYLKTDGTPAPGIGYRFDSCSQTPYVYNASAQIMISYDNAQSFAAKGAFVVAQGLRGFSMWEACGDYTDILLDSILQAAGFS